MTEADRDRLILATANAVAQLMAAHNGGLEDRKTYSESNFRLAQRFLQTALNMFIVGVEPK